MFKPKDAEPRSSAPMLVVSSGGTIIRNLCRKAKANASIVEKYFTEEPDESFALMLATLRKGLVAKMSRELLEQEANYQTSMLMFRSLLEKGILTAEEYKTAEQMMKKKYEPIVGTLFSDIELT